MMCCLSSTTVGVQHNLFYVGAKTKVPESVPGSCPEGGACLGACCCPAAGGAGEA